MYERRPTTEDAAVANVEQAAAWNGPEGASWADRPAQLVNDGDLVGPLLDAVRIRSGDRVLDVGCGTGAMTREAAWLAGRGEAVGVDLSELMVHRARRTVAEEGPANARFEVGDAQVHPFPPAGFDVVVSHFGVMFFADPVAAFANLARALRPGGRLAFVCPRSMDRCDWYGVPLAALLGRPPTEAEEPSAMFSLARRSVVRDTLAAAGLVDVEIRELDRSLWFGADAATAADAYLGSGPVRAVLAREGAPTPDAARRALEEALAPHAGPDGVRLAGAHWLVLATRPPRRG